MSAFVACKCPDRPRRPSVRLALPSWRVIDRRCNHSAFNGYRRTYSRYSCIRCLKCGGYWRTRADYVDRLRDATREEALRSV